jgi:hypothetical protein
VPGNSSTSTAQIESWCSEDCLVDLAPFAYLNERYGGELAVLWIDAIPRRCWLANITSPLTPSLLPTTSTAKALLAKFNATAADAEEERRVLLVQLLRRIGEGTVLKPTGATIAVTSPSATGRS